MPQIKPGRWKTRGGEVAEVLGRSKDKLYPWVGFIVDSVIWTNAGLWLYSEEDEEDEEDERDLVEYLGPLDDTFNLVAHLTHQREWSERTFGPGARTLGVIDHIRKELAEIETDPLDIREWVDVIILAFDGAWRAGWQPEDIVKAIVEKQAKNEQRTWPDWQTMSPNQAIEHDRSKDKSTTNAGGESND